MNKQIDKYCIVLSIIFIILLDKLFILLNYFCFLLFGLSFIDFV